MGSKNMIYNISGDFYNSFDYPFNIKDGYGNNISNFGDNISSVVNLLSSDTTEHKVRFIWIAAEGYCQTEVFLKQILSQFDNPVLYLHWLDYINIYDANEKNPIGKTICNITTPNNEYFSSLKGIKICVIDHAEEITNINHIYALCDDLGEYTLNEFVFIFISKSPNGINGSKKFWEKLTMHMGDKECLSILRSQNNFYIVERYSYEICEQIFKKSISNEEVKNKCCKIVNTIVDDMRRVLYLDLILNYIKKYSSAEQVPESFNDEKFINKVYTEASKGFVQAHIKACANLRDFIEKYMNSSFVKDFSLGEQQRIPLDNYIWACGIANYTRSEQSYIENIKFLFESFQKSINTKSFDAIYEINKQVINYAIGNALESFSIQKFLETLLNHSLHGARFCAETLNDIHTKLPSDVVESIFKSLCKKYNENLKNENQINTFRLLGIQIGRVLPKMKNEVIQEALSPFFEVVNDDYICPRCNHDGISVIPVTNFEFEKFVKDNGYQNYYTKEINKPLSPIARQYYRNLLEYILSALSSHNLKGSKCLASILKGYDWLQYKQIAYLYSHRDHINDSEIYNYIENENYTHPLRHPAKWVNETNEDTKKAFCNPLQPVVCINLFEARAYAKWLSNKINKDVRLVKYDPDYISIIGTQNDGTNNEQRDKFLAFLNKNKHYMNVVENSRLFYGEEFIEIREPTPVAIPNSLFVGIYDFLGNVFESQDTLYNYNYDDSISNATIEIFEKKQETLIDYNCPCGGLQRTKANLPPEYMGQVPAFLRNQDIGFRIVISGGIETGEQHKVTSSFVIDYNTSTQEDFHISYPDSEKAELLYNISVGIFNNTLGTIEKTLSKNEIFENDNTSVLLLSDDKSTNEFIMLVSDNNNIYAYQLNYITCLKSDIMKSNLSIISRSPIVPIELGLRKKCKNKDFANWIDFVCYKQNDVIKIFTAQNINIDNGFFRISEHKINNKVTNATFHKKDASLIGLFKIFFETDNEEFKTQYYDNLKAKLGTDFFLPDWINIVDYIEHIALSIPISNNLDIDTIMAAITTIDTSHLHEQINKKELLEIENNRLIDE